MPTIDNSYATIRANRLSYLIESSVQNYPNRDEIKDNIRAYLEQHIPQKRLSGLISGKYEMSLHEFILISSFFRLSINPLLIIDFENITTIDQVIERCKISA
jgi:hypothetical protein